jgi:predicted GIY-YIG superfamily endonuclease
VTFWVYMLRCSDDSIYTGHTDELERRIAQHGEGAAADYTRWRRPVRLLWSGTFASREEALALERQVKGWSRAKKEALVGGDFDAVSRLGRSRLG